MFVPRSFSVDDASKIDFMREYPFAVLFSAGGDGPTATHVPLLIDSREDGGLILLGHVARANPQWRSFDGETDALAVFSGPHAYISPAWYTTTPAVPTWNYLAVHAAGRIRHFRDKARLVAIAERTTHHFEAKREHPWQPEWPEGYVERMTQHIVGIEMEVAELSASFKLGQDKTADDRRGTVAALESSQDPLARELARLTRQHTEM